MQSKSTNSCFFEDPKKHNKGFCQAKGHVGIFPGHPLDSLVPIDSLWSLPHAKEIKQTPLGGGGGSWEKNVSPLLGKSPIWGEGIRPDDLIHADDSWMSWWKVWKNRNPYYFVDENYHFWQWNKWNLESNPGHKTCFRQKRVISEGTNATVLGPTICALGRRQLL